MCQFFIALFGLYALVIGKFRLARDIAVEGNRARVVGLILVAPLVITFCMVMVSASDGRNITDAEIEELNGYAMVLMVLSLVGAVYLSLTAPKKMPVSTSQTPASTQAPQTPHAVPIDPPTNSVTVAEAAAMLSLSENEVHHLIQTGQIKSMYLNMQDFIPLESVQEYRGRMQH
ncbi:MAG TPA: helix-turn-helix domain-containing protein [Aggregatilineaceae bacterium]|nr:helix-turn-helix domain-containing protein [Aggregatilineaceae bacterium]